MSDDAEPVAVDLEDRGIEGVAQTGGARQHRREHGLDVGRRAGDDAQDLGRRGLLLPARGSAAGARRGAFDLTRALVISAYDGAGGPVGLAREGRAALLAELRLRAILVLAPGTVHTERLPIPDRERPARHSVTAPGPPPELGVPAVPWGTGAPTLPRPGLGRQMGGSGAWFALEPVGRPHRRLRRVRTHVYATLLTATRRPGALSPTRLSPHRNRARGIR